jgi:hypothetical protein
VLDHEDGGGAQKLLRNDDRAEGVDCGAAGLEDGRLLDDREWGFLQGRGKMQAHITDYVRIANGDAKGCGRVNACVHACY